MNILYLMLQLFHEQKEYIRGISAWNFNLEDLKSQAALVSIFTFLLCLFIYLIRWKIRHNWAWTSFSLWTFYCWQQIQDADISNAEEPKEISECFMVPAVGLSPLAANNSDGAPTLDKEVLFLS